MAENNQTTSPQDGAGLPMSPKWDPEKLALEKENLRALEALPLGKRSWGDVKRTGPGLLQSAMTLGAGSATASVLAGASVGYKLLWVQPLAMFFGVMMLGALSNVVLTRGERPYESFGKQVWKPLVFMWALGTVLASVIWHFPQYTLLAGAGRDLNLMLSGAAGELIMIKPNERHIVRQAEFLFAYAVQDCRISVGSVQMNTESGEFLRIYADAGETVTASGEAGLFYAQP